jgi:hypothetical protein
MLLLSVINWRSFMLSRRPSIRRIFGIQGLDHGCCSISTSDSWYSYHRCSSHIQSHSRFIAIVLRAISSPCYRYRYPPRSTDPIPLVLILLSYRPCQSITVATVPSSPPPSSQSLKLSSRSCPVAVVVVRYIYVTNHSIQASQKLGP